MPGEPAGTHGNCFPRVPAADEGEMINFMMGELAVCMLATAMLGMVVLTASGAGYLLRSAAIGAHGALALRKLHHATKVQHEPHAR